MRSLPCHAASHLPEPSRRSTFVSAEKQTQLAQCCSVNFDISLRQLVSLSVVNGYWSHTRVLDQREPLQTSVFSYPLIAVFKANFPPRSLFSLFLRFPPMIEIDCDFRCRCRRRRRQGGTCYGERRRRRGELEGQGEGQVVVAWPALMSLGGLIERKGSQYTQYLF